MQARQLFRYWLIVRLAIPFRLDWLFLWWLLSNFPSLTADVFAAKHMAINYGFVMVGFGAGAILAAQIAGHYKNLAAQNIDLMFPAFAIASACAFIGVVLMIMLKVILQKESKA